MENNEILGHMFDLDEASPNIAIHIIRCSDKACKRSSILPDILLDQMLDQMLDRLHRPSCAVNPGSSRLGAY